MARTARSTIQVYPETHKQFAEFRAKNGLGADEAVLILLDAARRNGWAPPLKLKANKGAK